MEGLLFEKKKRDYLWKIFFFLFKNNHRIVINLNYTVFHLRQRFLLLLLLLPNDRRANSKKKFLLHDLFFNPPLSPPPDLPRTTRVYLIPIMEPRE